MSVVGDTSPKNEKSTKRDGYHWIVRVGDIVRTPGGWMGRVKAIDFLNGGNTMQVRVDPANPPFRVLVHIVTLGYGICYYDEGIDKLVLLKKSNRSA